MKSSTRLWQDGQVTVIAGTLTTAWALSTTLYHLLAQPDTLRKLKAELESAIPEPSSLPSLSTLENLPYLSAVLAEGLRLSNGVSSRLQRISPNLPLTFTDATSHAKSPKVYTIPPGTPCSMTGLLIHTSPLYFPDPTSFMPERWLDNPRLNRYLVPFSRGTRQCIGINLAYAELYLTLAGLFRVYGSKEVRGDGDKGWLELWETSFERDVEIVGDGITPLVRTGSEGIRIKVRK
jgi:cytochrome P450